MAPEPEDDIMAEKNPRPLDEDDIALLKTYVSAATPSDLPPSLRICVSVWRRSGAGLGAAHGFAPAVSLV